jgi:hypothetical protein
MDQQMMKRLGLGAKLLDRPRSIINVDGTGNKGGTLTKYTDLNITHQGTTEVQRFYITNLGNDRAIFGFPWLQTFKPKIDWGKAEIAGRTVVRTTKEEPPKWAQIARGVLTAQRITKDMQLEEGEEIHVFINRTNVTQQWAEKSLTERKDDLITETTIPKQYSEFADVFSESTA